MISGLTKLRHVAVFLAAAVCVQALLAASKGRLQRDTESGQLLFDLVKHADVAQWQSLVTVPAGRSVCGLTYLRHVIVFLAAAVCVQALLAAGKGRLQRDR
jgi:hypothetical protein